MQQAKELIKKLRAAYEKKDDDLGLKLLAQLKLLLLEFSALPPATPAAPTAPQREELEIAREVLEYRPLVSPEECMQEAKRWCLDFYARL